MDPLCECQDVLTFNVFIVISWEVSMRPSLASAAILFRLTSWKSQSTFFFLWIVSIQFMWHSFIHNQLARERMIRNMLMDDEYVHRKVCDSIIQIHFFIMFSRTTFSRWSATTYRDANMSNLLQVTWVEWKTIMQSDASGARELNIYTASKSSWNSNPHIELCPTSLTSSHFGGSIRDGTTFVTFSNPSIPKNYGLKLNSCEMCEPWTHRIFNQMLSIPERNYQKHL